MTVTSIQMPQLGETIIEGTILKWLKQEGDTIERDEPLFEISTDKVDTEVPSPVAGTVTKILVPEGETVAGRHRTRGDRLRATRAAAAPAAPARLRRVRARLPRLRRGLPRPVAGRAARHAPSPGSRSGNAPRRCPTVGRGRRSSRHWCGNSPPSTTSTWRRSPEQAPEAASPNTTLAAAIGRTATAAAGAGGGLPQAATPAPAPCPPRSPAVAGPRRRGRADHAHPQGDRRAHGRLARRPPLAPGRWSRSTSTTS